MSGITQREPWEPLESLDWAKIMRLADKAAVDRERAMQEEIEHGAWRYRMARA